MKSVKQTHYLRKFKREDFTEELAQLEITKTDIEKVVKESEETELTLKERLDELDESLEKEYEKLHSVDESLDIEQINHNIKDKEDQKVQWQIDKRDSEEKLKDHKKRLVELNTKIVKYKTIERDYDEWVTRKNERDEIVGEIERHKIQVQETLKRLESVKNNLHFEVNDECQSCLNNVKKFNEEYNNTLTELKEQKSLADKLVGRKEEYGDVETKSYLEEQYNDYTELTSESSSLDLQKQKLENEVDKSNTNIEKLEGELHILHERVEEYYSNENKIKENLSIRKVIDELKDTKKTTKTIRRFTKRNQKTIQ
jgi:chromosome segregation ATPase